MRYGQLVMGPAGSGKSTYCSNLVQHCENLRRSVHVVNLDPAAEHFSYPVLVDIRELIEVDDAMTDEDLHFGPNGGLVFCMEYLVENLDWLKDQLDDIEDDYILFDCPGQIELYTHIPVMHQIVTALESWNFRICGVFLVDSQFMVEPSKFCSGVLTALSSMITLTIPHVNVMTKLDLLSKKARKNIDRYLEPEMLSLLNEEFDDKRFSKKFYKMNNAIAKMVDDYSLVKFLPLDQTDEESINDVLIQIDMAIQYGEDLDVKIPKERDQDDDDQAGGSFGS